MGTINYYTSDYITLASNIGDMSEYEDRDHYNTCMSALSEDVAAICGECPEFEWFQVQIVPGYYEGFSIGIALDTYEFWWDLEEKQQAIKEAAALRDLLIRLVVETEMQVCFPGWSTGWLYGLAESCTAINDAYKAMIGDIDKIPMRKESEVI